MLAAGTIIRSYRVLAPLGSGGMALVYRARDQRLGRDVALKVIRSEFAHDAERVSRFEREARATVALNHPNICTTYDVGTHEGALYIVMELLAGESVRTRLARGPIPIRKAIDWMIQAARGLAAAHEQGIVHRDFKPDNLFLTTEGHVKVLDFGLAKWTDVRASSGTAATEVLPTRAGQVLGTAGYMAPEQVRGEAADPRVDLFAFGAVFYELLIGERAFDAETFVETSYRILNEDPPPLAAAGRGLPSDLVAIVERCLEKNPHDRFQNARDLAFALEAVATRLQGPEASRSPTATRNRPRIRDLAVGLLAGMLLVAGGAFLIPRHPAPARPTFQKLSFGRGRVTSARFTPDGNSVIYGAAWEGREPELYSTRIDAPGAVPLGMRGSVISVQRGEAIVGYWEPGSSAGATVATIPLTGGSPRPILKGVTGGVDWRQDGKTFARVHVTTGRSWVEYPPDNEIFSTGGWVSSLGISPRGDRVVFLHYPYRGSISGAVMVADTTGHTSVLSAGWAAVETAKWSPEGTEVWFTAGKIWGQKALYAVTLDGTVRTLLADSASPSLLDVFRDGRVLLAVGTETSEIWGRAASDSTEQSYSWFDGGVAAGLSVDGANLLFTECSVGGGAVQSMYLRRLDGSPPLRLGPGSGHCISPDGNWVLAGEDSTLTMIPTGAGATRRLPGGSVVLRQAAAFFPDGAKILISGNEAGRPQRLFVQSLSGGAPQPISPEGCRLPIPSDCISPNGLWVAAIYESRPVLISATGGDPQLIEGLFAGEEPVAWSRDGKALFVVESRRGPALRVVRFELASRKRILWRELRLRDPAGAYITYQPAIARDGAVYFYTAYRSLSNLFLVEGLK